MRKNKLYYLASPYSHDDIGMREQRFKQVCMIAGKLLSQALYVYCPIAESHSIAEHSSAVHVLDHGLWMRKDLLVLHYCDGIIVCKLPGWEQSKGVQQEIAYAIEHDIPVMYVNTLAEFVEENEIL